MAKSHRRRQRSEMLERPYYGWIWKPLLALVIIYLVVCIGLGIWWSQRPGAFGVEQAVSERRDGATTPTARGTVITATLATAVDTLLDKPGGFLRNDVAPPGVWLDNVPSWEYGVLRQSRLLVEALPALNDGQTASISTAQQALSTDSTSWLYPTPEKRYAKAVEALETYLQTLAMTTVEGFATRGDAIKAWLQPVEQRLGELTQRLSASVDDPQALRELGVDESALPDATPWYRIDNSFFEARGEGWALMHFLRALEHDYADLIAKAEATSTLQRLIAELEMAQQRLWSPIILNGSGFGMFANHSLLLANYIANARELVEKLVTELKGVELDEAATSEADDAASASGPGGDGEQASNSEAQQLDDQARQAAVALGAAVLQEDVAPVAPVEMPSQ